MEKNYLAKKKTKLKKAAAAAFQLFQEEEKRLIDIELLWMGVIEAKQCHLLAAREAAAVAYWNEDATEWDHLPPKAKEEYNDQITKLNAESEKESEERL